MVNVTNSSESCRQIIPTYEHSESSVYLHFALSRSKAGSALAAIII